LHTKLEGIIFRFQFHLRRFRNLLSFHSVRLRYLLRLK